MTQLDKITGASFGVIWSTLVFHFAVDQLASTLNLSADRVVLIDLIGTFSLALVMLVYVSFKLLALYWSYKQAEQRHPELGSAAAHR